MLTEGLLTTILLTVIAFVGGAVLAAPLTLLRFSSWAVVRGGTRAFVELVRAVPPIVWLLVIYLGLGSTALRLDSFGSAALALAIISAAYLSEIYRAGVLSVGRGQWEASRSVGLSDSVAFRTVIFQQAIPLVVPPAAAFAIGLLKDTAIASVIGAKDITYFAFQQGRLSGDSILVFVVAGAVYVALSVPIGVIARRSGQALERRLERAHA